VGLSVSPQSLLQNDFTETDRLFCYWSGTSAHGGQFIATKIALKKHFHLSILRFGLHLIGISCINNLFNPFGFVFAIVLAATLFYFL
jgi:hypothetical protein